MMLCLGRLLESVFISIYTRYGDGKFSQKHRQRRSIRKQFGMIEPRRFTLHTSVPREFVPFVKFEFLRYVNAQAKLFTDIVYTLVETAKANGLDPYSYLHLLLMEFSYLEKISRQEKLDAFLPWTPKSKRSTPNPKSNRLLGTFDKVLIPVYG